jgi:RNA polymerase-associated protein
MNVIVSGSALKLMLRVSNCVKSCWRLRRVWSETFFLSDEFSLVDCYLAPLLWRLPVLGVEFSGLARKS